MSFVQESEVFNAYKRASRRIFFLDYGGTLSTKQGACVVDACLEAFHFSSVIHPRPCPAGALQERLTFLMGMQGRDRPIPLTDDMTVRVCVRAPLRDWVFMLYPSPPRRVC